MAHFLSEPRIWSVYVHTNKQNGKKYVGITSAKPERRWNNGLGYLQCSAMNNAIRKYGWDGFEHFVFPDKYTKTEACLLERMLIKSLHSNVNENGYNIDIGGSCGASGRILSEETKKKISQNHADISGDKCYWYGKKRSQETKEKMSISKKSSGVCAGGNNPSAKAVVCLNTGEYFSYIKEAARKYHTTRNTIAKNCNKELKRAGHADEGESLAWMFVSEYEATEKRVINEIVESIKYDNGQKHVRCLETGEVFANYKEASKKVGLKDSSKIGLACRNNSTAGGFHWDYIGGGAL